MAFGELAALEIFDTELRGTYQIGPGRIVSVGIGDDAAIFRPPAGELVWTIDASQEGVHFLREWMSPADVAHKSFHAALSDVPAMGASAIGALCHVTLTNWTGESWVREFARAQARVAREAQVPIIGGNLTWGDRVGVVTTVVGSIPTQGALLRGGAVAGEEIWLVGELGLAAAGLSLLRRGGLLSSESALREAEDRCLLAFRRPQAQVRAGPVLVKRASSCVDISDGLFRDAMRLSEASATKFIFEENRLRETLSEKLLLVASELGSNALRLATQGGEDYALLATGRTENRPDGALVVGRVADGTGVFLKSAEGMRALAGGFEHGAP